MWNRSYVFDDVESSFLEGIGQLSDEVASSGERAHGDVRESEEVFIALQTESPFEVRETLSVLLLGEYSAHYENVSALDRIRHLQDGEGLVDTSIENIGLSDARVYDSVDTEVASKRVDHQSEPRS